MVGVVKFFNRAVHFSENIECTCMHDLTGRILHQPVSQIIMHRNHKY